MTFRESHSEPDIELGSGAEVVQRRCIPLFTLLIGLLAAMNVASVVFVLLD